MASQIKTTSTVRWTDSYTRKMADHLAKISGQSVNGVVMTAIRYYGEHYLSERKNAMTEFGPIILSANDYLVLMESLEKAPAPNAALKRAMSRHRKTGIRQKKAGK